MITYNLCANTTVELGSELDVLMLGCVFPKYISVTAKKSLKYWPFLGWFSTLSASTAVKPNAHSRTQ